MPDPTQKKRIDELMCGDLVDLEGDPFFLKDNPDGNNIAEYEYALVCEIEVETADCVRIDFDWTSVGFPPDHVVTMMPADPNAPPEG